MRYFFIKIISLFIICLITAVVIILKQYEHNINDELSKDKLSAALTADIIREHEKAALSILNSYASRPSLLTAVKQKNIDLIHSHLENLSDNNNEMDLYFITDTKGVLWVNFPVFPEAIGRNLSDRDWYKGISKNWKPYISTVFQLIVADKPLAVALSVPVFD